VIAAMLIVVIIVSTQAVSDAAKDKNSESNTQFTNTTSSVDSIAGEPVTSLNFPTAAPYFNDTSALISEIIFYRDQGSKMPPDLIDKINTYIKKSATPSYLNNLPQRPYPEHYGCSFPYFYFNSDLEGFYEKYSNYMHFTTYKEIHLKPGEVIEVPIIQTSMDAFSSMTPIITYSEYDDNIIDLYSINEYDGSGFDNKLIDLQYWCDSIKDVRGVPDIFPIFGIYHSDPRNFVVVAEAPGVTKIHVYGINKADENDPEYDNIDKREFTVIDVFINVYVDVE